jgi:hypothetical protein
MTQEPNDGHDPARTRIDGHRLSEFIYGTVTGLVAVTGISGDAETSWLGAALVVITGAMAIWLAHAYAMLLSRRISQGQRLAARDLGAALAASWPIVSAGVLLALPMLLVALHLWSLEFALQVSGLVGVSILALAGILAGVITQETWPRRLLLAVLSAGLGVAVVVIELLVHH